eukprot:2339994-Rhodomonas_salina.1
MLSNSTAHGMNARRSIAQPSLGPYVLGPYRTSDGTTTQPGNIALPSDPRTARVGWYHESDMHVQAVGLGVGR